MTLYVYADESGMHDDPGWCLIGGYIASVRQWMKFGRAWQKILDDDEAPAFHSIEFFGRKEPYRNWTREKWVAHGEALANTIHNHRLTPLGASVNVSEFLEQPYGFRKMLTGGIIGLGGRGRLKWMTTGKPSSPYLPAFQLILIEATQNAKDGMKINFVFERQNVVQSLAIITFEDIKKMIAPLDRRMEKLGGIRYEGREDHIGLQAADMYVSPWYSYLVDGDAMQPERRMVLDILTKKKKSMKNLNKASMEMLLAERELLPNERAFMLATLPPVKNKEGKS